MALRSCVLSGTQVACVSTIAVLTAVWTSHRMDQARRDFPALPRNVSAAGYKGGMQTTESALRVTEQPRATRQRMDVLVPVLVALMIVLYVVSLAGMLTVMPAQHDTIHLTKPMIAWACIGMFESVLVYPLGMFAIFRMRPKPSDRRNPVRG